MGVVWSVLGAYGSSSDGTSQENARRGNAGDSVSAVSTGTRTEPQFLADVRAEPAAWTHDGYCRSFQRFIGYLPDSPGEILKQQQRYPVFALRSSSLSEHGSSHRTAAALVLQHCYRRHRLLRMWHHAAFPMVELARSRLASQHADQELEAAVANFRQMLIAGFAAKKVSISGELKTIQLRLVANAGKGEFYLTWSPSRKRNPRIFIHDIEQVVAVQKEGNQVAPRLADKVSHRRGLIIVCKSYHRGRVILEVGSKSERKLLLRGFERLLQEMNHEEPVLDATGTLRKRQPRRQSVAMFFDENGGAAGNSSATDLPTGEDLPPEITPVTPTPPEISPEYPPQSPSAADGSSLVKDKLSAPPLAEHRPSEPLATSPTDSAAPALSPGAILSAAIRKTPTETAIVDGPSEKTSSKLRPRLRRASTTMNG